MILLHNEACLCLMSKLSIVSLLTVSVPPHFRHTEQLHQRQNYNQRKLSRFVYEFLSFQRYSLAVTYARNVFSFDDSIAHALESMGFHQFYLFFLLHYSLRRQQQSIELPWQTRETLVAFSLNSLVATAHHWVACPTLRNVGVHQSAKKSKCKEIIL